MMNFSSEVNIPVTITVKGLGPSQPAPTDIYLLKDGVLDSSTGITFQDVGIGSLYNFTFVPLSTGVYTLHAFDKVQARVEVVTQSVYNTLRNLEDEALGSWQWDKVAGTLVLLRRDGTTLAQFAVVDNLETSSRERTL